MPDDPTKTDPRRALSLAYACMFGHMGVILPFLAPWFQQRGFGPVGIGFLMALPALFKVLAPWSWGVWADRSGRRRELLIAAFLGAAVALAVLPLVDGALAIALVVILYSFARAPILPYVEATTLEQSEQRRFAYGPIRLWGSIAFMVVSALYGWSSGYLFADAGLWIAAGMLGVAVVPALLAFPYPLDRGIRDRAARDQVTPGSRETRREIVRLLLACALMQVSHGAYYTFYSIQLGNLGFGGGTIGGLWALGVLCEVLLLTRMDGIVARFGPGPVMQLSLVVAALRWATIGWATSLPWLALAQTLHAVTYAAFHVAAIREVFRLYGSAARARGQAMFSGMTYGLGMFLGALGAGWLGARLGLPALFFVSAAVALSALVVLGRPAAAARQVATEP